ncbi:hypothetical protein [Dielma fastidiosa]|uniref:hypothetical protein n=1 Tax=Dielma fastidiosa TaxID=1034346 RepID=UPI0035642113
MPQKSRIHTASEKLTVLNLLEQSTATFQILFDCGPCKALELKKKVKQKIIESGKLLPCEDKVPTAAAIKYLMIDEVRIRKLAAIEAAEQEKRDASTDQIVASQS